MRWNELATRVTQEASKRVELASHRLGISTKPLPSIPEHNALRGEFFFSTHDLQERTLLIQEHLSAKVSAIISDADRILQHRFQLLGYRNVDYGHEIDWHLDAVHGKRAPLKPWFKIRYLDFSEVGDHKIIWELNRHQHLVTLARAWRFTRDNQYIDELLRQWYGWQLANPYPMGINWSSSLEVAVRSLSWLWVRHLLDDCQALPAGFISDLSRALAFNARYIDRYLSTYFSPNTHLLGEAVALFFVGTLCPQFKYAKQWRDHGWRILLEEAERQVRPDGVYFEQSLYYHVYALDFFLHARLLASRNQLGVPASFDAILQKMLGVVARLSQAGPLDGFGDDDGGRVFDPRRNRPEHLGDSLAVGGLLFARKDLLQTASLTEEAIWLFGGGAISSFKVGARDVKALSSTAFESAGLYLMASSGKRAEQMTIDAGPQGNANSGHGHADALSVNLSTDGRKWLVDAGAYSYLPEDRDSYRGTSAHNTLRVDRVDQAIPSGPFGWSAIPNVHAELWIAGQTFSLFAGSHDGYTRLTDPVLHRRIIFHLNGQFWLVGDIAAGKELHELEIFWHFAADLTVAKRANAFVASPLHPEGKMPQIRLALLPVEDPGWTIEICSGFVSPAYGHRDQATIVRCSSHLKLPAEHAVLLRPFSSPTGDFGNLIRVRAADDAALAYRYDESGKSHYVIFARPETAMWICCGFSSDARFLYACAENQRLTHFIFCGGKHASLNGKPLIAHHQIIERFEWEMKNVPQTFSSDGSVQATIDGM